MAYIGLQTPVQAAATDPGVGLAQSSFYTSAWSIATPMRTLTPTLPLLQMLTKQGVAPSVICEAEQGPFRSAGRGRRGSICYYLSLDGADCQVGLV